MIGLDTNVLARYYVDDEGDAQTHRQRLAARRLIDSGRPLMVAKTVVLELEWVMRGYYGFERNEVQDVFRHLFALPHVVIEDRETLERAIAVFGDGLDLADAIHHASYRACAQVASFDDRRFARKAKRLAMSPSVFVPD